MQTCTWFSLVHFWCTFFFVFFLVQRKLKQQQSHQFDSHKSSLHFSRIRRGMIRHSNLCRKVNKMSWNRLFFAPGVCWQRIVNKKDKCGDMNCLLLHSSTFFPRWKFWKQKKKQIKITIKFCKLKNNWDYFYTFTIINKQNTFRSRSWLHANRMNLILFDVAAV